MFEVLLRWPSFFPRPEEGENLRVSRLPRGHLTGASLLSLWEWLASGYSMAINIYYG